MIPHDVFTSIVEHGSNGNFAYRASVPGDIVLWPSHPAHGGGDVSFDNTQWLPVNRKDYPMSFDVPAPFIVPLKQYAITLLQSGGIMGEAGLKWRTTTSRVNAMARLCRFLGLKQVFSLSELARLPAIKMMHLLSEFVVRDDPRSGINVKASPTSGEDMVKALRFAMLHGWLSPSVYDAITSLVRKCAPAHRTLSHSIIPQGIVEQLLKEISDDVEQAKRNLPALTVLHDQYNEQLIKSRSRCDRASELYKSGETPEMANTMRALYPPFHRLRAHCFVLTALFTGIRKEEILSMKEDAPVVRLDGGVARYYVKAELTKTSSVPIEMEWVCDQSTYDALCLLRDFNQLMYRRAEILLAHKREQLKPGLVENLEYGLTHRSLFSVHPSKTSCSFGKARLLTVEEDGGTLSLKGYQRALSQRDVAMLDLMDCNYRVGGKQRGEPYAPGDVFNLTPHQFRHTFAWFVVANRLGDLDDIKYHFKHLSESMTIIYTQRGFEMVEELISTVSLYEEKLNNELAVEVARLGQEGRLAGGGGRILNKMAANMVVDGEDGAGNTVQLHFRDHAEYLRFVKSNFEHVRGLPHGVCVAGPQCKMTNAADPSSCVNCSNYIVSERHEKHWRVIQQEAKIMLDKVSLMPVEQRKPYEAMCHVWERNMLQATAMLNKLQTNREGEHVSQ